MALVLNWQKKLGYRKDPFIDEPTKDFIGQEKLKQKINLFLLKGHKLATLTTEKGMGLSSFILWLKAQLKQELLIITKEHSSKEKLEKFLYQKVIPIYQGELYRKLYLKITKDAINPLDQLLTHLKQSAHVLVIETELSNPQVELLEIILAQTPTQIILLNYSKNPFSIPITLKATFAPYHDEEFSSMLKARIEAVGGVKTFPFDTKELNKLMTKSKGNPKLYLQAAKDRAMELSLKGLPIPQKEVPKKIVAPKPVAKKERNQNKEFNLFGKIKFQVREESEQKPKEIPVPLPNDDEREIAEDKEAHNKSKEHKKHILTAKEEVQSEDEELLRQIVSSIEGDKK